MAHFTGISYGQKLTPLDLQHFISARKLFRDMNEILRDTRHLRKDQQTLLEHRRDSAQDTITKWSTHCTLINNVAIVFGELRPGGQEASRVVLAHVPPILRNPAMLPTLYEMQVKFCDPGEFVHNIEFL